MNLSAVDFVVIVGYMALAIGIGIYFSRRAGKSLTDFFLSGRQLPWWLAGTSIAATGFAADTPFMVTELVRRNGISGNWFLWCFAMSNLCATFVFFRFWRRANILTELEIIEKRYDGKAAAVLRGFQSIFYGIAFGALAIGFIMLAMQSFITVMLGWDERLALAALLAVTLIYSLASGLWGVVATDAVQFVMAFVGSLVLTVVAVDAIGGLSEIEPRLVASFGQGAADGLLSFVPGSGTPGPHAEGGKKLTWTLFLVYIFVLWWSSERADGNGLFVQRIMATKNDFHAFMSGIWFNVLYYAFLMWPWILVALISLIVFPELTDHKLAYPMMIQRFLPEGLRGLMFAAFLAAFMSSVDSMLNWGSSYMINDFYKRFVNPEASQRHYIWIGRAAMLVILGFGVLVWTMTDSLADAWKFMAELFSGLGTVWLARWFWWRVNAWSEISAYVLSVLGCVAINLIEAYWQPIPEELRYLSIMAVSTIGWLTVTLLTRPVSNAKLEAFVKEVNPGGPFWRRISSRIDSEELPSGPPLAASFSSFIAGAACLFSIVFGMGSLIFGSHLQGALLLAISVVMGFAVYRLERLRRGGRLGSNAQ